MSSEVEARLKDLLRRNLGTKIDLTKIGEELENVAKKVKNEKQLKNRADDLVKQLYYFNHPLFRRVINWGNVGRGARKRLKRKIIEVLRKVRFREEAVSKDDIDEIRRLVREFHDEVIEDVMKEISDASKGLRRYHVLSSLALSETRNLYFGESFRKEQLLELTEKFLRSVGIGNRISVYFERGVLADVQENLRHLILERFPRGGGHILREDLRELRIHELESSKPYIVLTKFLLWLYDNYDMEKDPEKKRLLEQIIDDLKGSAGMLYFMPSSKSEWRIIAIPSLNIFTLLWLENPERRKVLEMFCEQTFIFFDKVLRRAGREEGKKAENELEILANALELFYKDLVEVGRVNFGALRTLIDQVIYLSQSFRVPLSLSFIKYLTM
ncbi:MAG: hypothetical protein DRJ52_08635 [Thermoprotei archaeon]|nr:MAG: hypothetical protein DRJ52_08635 [Thermoprotei archaeon]